ncbi:MAG: protein kinase [Byssovorax sp.]
MALSNARKVVVGQTPFAHEREALDFVFSVLPDTDPYQVWALTELLDPSTGRLYEIDLLVLGYAALYLVEIKSGPGRYEGDHQEWWRTPPGETRPRYMDGPYPLTNHKAKVLKSRLLTKMARPKDCPFIEPLVFLSATDLDLRLKPEGRIAVVTRSDLLPALQHHRYPGANPAFRGDRIDRPTMHDVAQALQALGLRPTKGRAYAGSYELGALLAEGAGYQDREASHRDRGFKTRARVYLVPQQANVDRRQQLRRAADREATLLWDLREHPSILRIADYVTDAPLGPTVLFDNFPGGVPLDAFLRHNPALTFTERLTLVELVGRALAHCHRKAIVHGAVAPQSILARRHPDTGALDVRLFNFQLGTGREVEVTQHWSALADEGWAVYQAPELRENPLAKSPQSDIFSLGALAYFVFTGRAPGERAEEVDRRLETKRYLDPRAVDDGVRPKVAEVFAFATDAAPVNRCDSVDEWLDLLLAEATAPEDKPPAAEIDPLEARPGDVLAGGLRVERLLGVGSTARVLLVQRESDDRWWALKVATEPAHDARLADEAAVLDKLPRHQRIVELKAALTIAGRACLLLSVSGEVTLQQKLTRTGPVLLDEASRYGDDPFSPWSTSKNQGAPPRRPTRQPGRRVSWQANRPPRPLRLLARAPPASRCPGRHRGVPRPLSPHRLMPKQVGFRRRPLERRHHPPRDAHGRRRASREQRHRPGGPPYPLGRALRRHAVRDELVPLLRAGPGARCRRSLPLRPGDAPCHQVGIVGARAQQPARGGRAGRPGGDRGASSPTTTSRASATTPIPLLPLKRARATPSTRPASPARRTFGPSAPTAFR